MMVTAAIAFSSGKPLYIDEVDLEEPKAAEWVSMDGGDSLCLIG